MRNPFMNDGYYIRPAVYRKRNIPSDYYIFNRMRQLQEMDEMDNYQNLAYKLLIERQKQQNEREKEMAIFLKQQEEALKMYQEEMKRKQLEAIRQKQLEEIIWKQQEELKRKQLEEMKKKELEERKKREYEERKKLNDEIMKFDEQYARQLQEEEYKNYESTKTDECNNEISWKPQDKKDSEIRNEKYEENDEDFIGYIEPEPITDSAQSADQNDLLKFDDL